MLKFLLERLYNQFSLPLETWAVFKNFDNWPDKHFTNTSFCISFPTLLLVSYEVDLKNYSSVEMLSYFKNSSTLFTLFKVLLKCYIRQLLAYLFYPWLPYTTKVWTSNLHQYSPVLDTALATKNFSLLE